LRQARWREAIASVYDLPDLRPHLGAVRRIEVEYAAAEPGDPAGQDERGPAALPRRLAGLAFWA